VRPSPVPRHVVTDIVDRALAEDLATAGDITTNAIFGPDDTTTGCIVARVAGVVAGLEASVSVFARLDDGVAVELSTADGDGVDAGTVLATVTGPTRAILTGERTCLNLLGHLSGIATATRAIVEAVADAGTRVADTRKTTPGLRSLEKYAVRCGGGANHRFGLHDAVMIKDNHLLAAGSIGGAVEAVRRAAGHTVKIELEIDDLAQVDEAIDAGVDVVLLDNMAPDELRTAVDRIDGRAITEASGGITPETAREVAATGVDVISVGWMTHSAPRLDVALDLMR
jgi:nicotinate-nucleotide pyrophosphorylase (carboxylating)